MATDFYMTLPSNASMKLHPDNTLAHYITDLPHRIHLTGEWECGLAEIQYPHTWYNVTEADVWFFLSENDTTGRISSTKLSSGYYNDPLTLMYHVNKGLYSMWTDKVRAHMSYSSVTQKMTLHMTPNTVFTEPYHSATAPMLGFRRSVVTTSPVVVAIEAESTRVHPTTSLISPPNQISDDSYPFHNEADDVVSMTRGFDTIYVYTDVVESRIVGESLGLTRSDFRHGYTFFGFDLTPDQCDGPCFHLVQ